MSVITAVHGQLSGYRRLLGLRDYRLLWSAQVVSTFGDRLTQIALTTLVFALTGSDLSVGLVLTLTVLPRAIFGIPAGALADRVSRKSLLIATDLVRAAIVLGLALGAGLPLALVYLLTAMHATATVFFTPTRCAVVPDLVPRDQLLDANTLDETTQSALDPVAYLVGGAVIAAVGVRPSFVVDAFSFIASALLIAMTTARSASLWRAPQSHSQERAVGSDIWGGFAVLWRHPTLRANTLLMLFAASIASAEMPLTYMLVFDHWRMGALGLGVFEASLAAGFVVGALGCGAIVARTGKGVAILIGLVGTGLTMTLIAVLPFWPAAVLNAVSGVFNILFFVPTLTLHQQLAPVEMRARVLSARSAILALALAASYALATALTLSVRPQDLLAVMGVVLAVGAAAAAAVPELRRL